MVDQFTTPFKAKTLKEERNDKYERFTVRLNLEEQKQIDHAGRFLEQKKRSTIIKQLALIGYNVIQDKKIIAIANTIFKNKRNNKLQGIIEFE